MSVLRHDQTVKEVEGRAAIDGEDTGAIAAKLIGGDRGPDRKIRAGQQAEELVGIPHGEHAAALGT